MAAALLPIILTAVADIIKARAGGKKATAADVKATATLVKHAEDLHKATIEEAGQPPETAGP